MGPSPDGTIFFGIKGATMLTLFLAIAIAAALTYGVLLALKSARGRLILGAIVAVAVALAVAGAYMFVAYQAPQEVPPALLPPSGPPYAGAWRAPPQEGSLPSWVMEKELFDPQSKSIGSGATFQVYVPKDAEGRLAGYSDFEAEKAEALKQAWECLILRLRSLVMARFAELPSRPMSRSDFALLGGLVEKEIRARQDELARSAEPPYEGEVRLESYPDSVYRAAVAVKISPELMKETRKAAIEGLESLKAAEKKQLTKLAYTFGGAIFLFLVIVAIYLFLNAHTRGYYAWPLRIAAALIYAISVFGFAALLYTIAS